MNLPSLILGDIKAKAPIIQGGMGIGVSRSGLSSAVAKEGGIGVISGVQIGFQEEDFKVNSKGANLRAIKIEIKKAKELSLGGIIGVNYLVAMNNYDEMVKAAVEANADIIISGAGIPTSLPYFTKGTKTKAAPIVSSGKAASVICKYWDRKFSIIPDILILEGPEAGGHLGFSEDNLLHKSFKLQDLLKDVKDAIIPFEKKYSKSIPVAVAGGIYSGEDIAKYLKLGASGVQIGTRFVTTNECDASINYKLAYINTKKEDIVIIKSPVGLPGRAIKNSFLEKVDMGNISIKKCYGCLRTCDYKNTPYCISEALIQAVKGNTEEGLIFCGSNAYRVDKIVSVKELMGDLIREAEKNY